eukprot:5528929-Lingulodinium_polyedra.AAC.1
MVLRPSHQVGPLSTQQEAHSPLLPLRRVLAHQLVLAMQPVRPPVDVLQAQAINPLGVQELRHAAREVVLELVVLPDVPGDHMEAAGGLQREKDDEASSAAAVSSSAVLPKKLTACSVQSGLLLASMTTNCFLTPSCEWQMASLGLQTTSMAFAPPSNVLSRKPRSMPSALKRGFSCSERSGTQ